VNAKTKHTVISATTSLIGAAIAANAGLDLAHHGVNIPLTLAAAAAIFSTALTLATNIANAARTRTWRCPTTGCDVEIRTQGVTAAEQERYEAYATDHSQHNA
jgi:hypothetical protein